MKSIAKSAASPGRPRARSWLLLWLPGALALAFGCTACKRADEGARPQTVNASSSQMPAPAGAQMAPASTPKP